MNILITSAGRRVELLKAFKKALNGDGKVFCGDANKLAPALYFADFSIELPAISSKEYIEKLIEICKINKIKLLIPTIDTELELLSKNAKRFLSEAECLVNISNPSVVGICRDKLETQKFFDENGIKSPSIIDIDITDKKSLKFPMFIKPRDGSSSINAYKINNLKEYLFFREYVKNPIIQEFVLGQEYTIDVLCDFNSNPICIVPRMRIAVRSGEILKGTVCKDENLINAAKDLVKKLKPKGMITLQCIMNESGIFFTEINPRFGGGAPMSIAAGADFPSYLIELAKGKKLSYTEDYKDNICVLRYDASIVL